MTRTYEWFGFVAGDNLPNRSGLRTPVEALRVLSSAMLDCPATLDHGYLHGVRGNFGRVVDAELLSMPAPRGLTRMELDAIAADDGYYQLILGVAVQTGHPEVEELRSQRHGECSISFLYSALRCPGCTCNKDVWSCERRTDSPYLERYGVTDGLEISLVVTPAVKRAMLIRQK